MPAPPPPPATLIVQMSIPDNDVTRVYSRPAPGPLVGPAQLHLWREIDTPRACDNALWLWIARAQARAVYGCCPVRVVLVRRQAGGERTLLDVQL